jgi:type III pantothenate kinase
MVKDVGNTNSVLGLYDGAEMIEHWRIATLADRTTDELGVLLVSLFATRGVRPEDISAAICATVVPPLVHTTRRACRRYLDVEPLFVSDLDLGIDVRYSLPRDVGADRLVNAVAAWEAYHAPCIIVDFGTATTFDVVGADGGYEGGVIAPGLAISLDALYQRASKLPRVEIVRPGAAIGTSTVTSMQAGIVYGYVGLVDGIVHRILDQLDDPRVRVIATGGLAGLISEESSYIEKVEPFLTLDGLRLCYERALAGGAAKDAAPKA